MKVLITGADRGVGFGLARLFLEAGDTVFAGRFLPEWNELDELKAEYPDRLHILPLDAGSDQSVAEAARLAGEITDSLDMLMSVAGINIIDSFPVEDKEGMLRQYNVNALGAARVTEAFMPMLERGEMRRLCYVSSEAGSVTQCERREWFGYCMSKSALNMYVKILYNLLHPQGFTFRLYHPGWVRSYMRGHLATEGILSIDEAAKLAYDYFLGEENEDELVLRDCYGNIYKY